MESDIASKCRELATSINSEDDARTRLQYCRQAIALGRTAVRTADTLSDTDLSDVQDTLRLAFRASRGTYNPNASITKLAKVRMERAGLTQLPIVSATRPKLVGTNSACLAISSQPLSGNWFDTHSAIKQMNLASYAVLSVGSDAFYSVILRLINADDHFLEYPEYKKVIEVSPPLAIRVENEQILFGAAEALENGVGFQLANGRYICSVSSLRSGRYPRFVATLIRSDDDVPAIHQLPEFREV